MLVRLTSAHPIFHDFQFPGEVVVHARRQPMWDTEGCPRCDPWPDPLPEAPLLFPDGSAYPGHYKLPPGTWRVQAFEGAPGWEIRLYKPQSKKHDKPWILQLKQVTRIVTSLADFKAPNPPPKLTLV